MTLWRQIFPLYLSPFDRRFWRFLWQRLTRGYSDEQTWNFDYVFLEWFLPRFENYVKVSDNYILIDEERRATYERAIAAMKAYREAAVLAEDPILTIRVYPEYAEAMSELFQNPDWWN